MKHTNGNASVVQFVRDMNEMPSLLRQKRDLDALVEHRIKSSYRFEAIREYDQPKEAPYHEIHWNMKIGENGALDYDIGIRRVESSGVRAPLLAELRETPHHVLKRYVEILGGLIEWLGHDGKTLPGKSDCDYPWPTDRRS
jgi:hypothetical protein